MRRSLLLGRFIALLCVLFFAPLASAATILFATGAANASFPNGRIFRLDYSAGTILNTFNGPAGVTIGDGFTGSAYRGATNELYVTDGSGTNTIFRINANTGAVNSSFPSPTGSNSVDGLEFVGGPLYALVVANGSIVTIQPDTGQLTGTLSNSVGGGGNGGLAFANGNLYSRSTANTSIAARSIVTGATLFSFPTPNNEAVSGLAGDGGDLYAASVAGVVYRLNPTTGAVVDSRNFGVAFDSLATLPEPSMIALAAVASLLLARRR